MTLDFHLVGRKTRCRGDFHGIRCAAVGTIPQGLLNMNLDVLKMLQFVTVAGVMVLLALWVLYFVWIRPTISRNRQDSLARVAQRDRSLHDLDTAFNEATEPKVQSSYRRAVTGRARLAATILELEPRSDLHWALMIREGLSAKGMDSVVRQSGLSKVELAQILGVSPEALDHQSEEKKLGPIESERLLRFVETLALAVDTLDDTTAAMSWLHLPHPELNNLSPLSLLDTEPGARSVQRVLASIAHGLPS